VAVFDGEAALRGGEAQAFGLGQSFGLLAQIFLGGIGRQTALRRVRRGMREPFPRGPVSAGRAGKGLRRRKRKMAGLALSADRWPP
jgi:hypothetical protein